MTRKTRGKKEDHYEPTCYLRWKWVGGTMRKLEQLWTSPLEGEEDKWREVQFG